MTSYIGQVTSRVKNAVEAALKLAGGVGFTLAREVVRKAQGSEQPPPHPAAPTTNRVSNVPKRHEVVSAPASSEGVVREDPKRAERQRQREVEPPKPLHPDASDPRSKDPHHALNNPVVDDPDLTEYPDPYERRPDPRGWDDESPAPRAPSTSEPHPPRNFDEIKPVKGNRED